VQLPAYAAAWVPQSAICEPVLCPKTIRIRAAFAFIYEKPAELARFPVILPTGIGGGLSEKPNTSSQHCSDGDAAEMIA
jgi:hypothetical protein